MGRRCGFNGCRRNKRTRVAIVAAALEVMESARRVKEPGELRERLARIAFETLGLCEGCAAEVMGLAFSRVPTKCSHKRVTLADLHSRIEGAATDARERGAPDLSESDLEILRLILLHHAMLLGGFCETCAVTFIAMAEGLKLPVVIGVVGHV
jgi:hypothetical protein